jgi:uncharacterized damage-inducible protein DinB
MSVSAATLRTHLDFTAWASSKLVEAAASLTAEELTRDLKVSFQSVLGTLGHIFGADRVWFDRIHGRSRTAMLDPGEELTLGFLQREWPALHARWGDWAAGIDDAGFGRVVTYRLLSGDPGESPLWQIVLHVVNHATYHRGQVTSLLRQLGRVPPSTDLIAYYRGKR